MTVTAWKTLFETESSSGESEAGFRPPCYMSTCFLVYLRL
jgi:hypothetical protein